MLSGFTAADRHTGSTRNHLDFAPVGGTSRSSGHARKGLGGWAKQNAHERAHDRRRLLQEGAVFASPRIAHGHSSLAVLSGFNPSPRSLKPPNRLGWRGWAPTDPHGGAQQRSKQAASARCGLARIHFLSWRPRRAARIAQRGLNDRIPRRHATQPCANSRRGQRLGAAAQAAAERGGSLRQHAAKLQCR